MAAVPMLAGVGIMMVCCSSSSIASLMMGGEEKKVPDGNDAAGEAQATADEAQAAADEAQAVADTVAADPNSTPDEVAAAKTKAKAAADKAAKDLADAARVEAERVRIANMTFRQKVIDGQYPTFAGCWAAGTLEGREFACCENIGTPYPERSDGAGYIYCQDNT